MLFELVLELFLRLVVVHAASDIILRALVVVCGEERQNQRRARKRERNQEYSLRGISERHSIRFLDSSLDLWRQTLYSIV